MGEVATNAADVRIGSGSVYFDRFTSLGAPTGLNFLGNVSSIEINPAEDETRELKDSTQPSRPTLKKVTITRKVTGKIVFQEQSPDNTALVLMGELAEYTQAATPVVGEVLSTTPTKGKHYKTAKRAIGSITVKRGATTIPAGEYTVVSAETGLIFLKNTATTFDGATGDLTIDYTPTAITAGSGRPWIKAGKSSVIEGRLLYVPSPLQDGPKHEYEFWKVSITAAAAMALISDDFAQGELAFEVLTDAINHPNEPLYQVIEQP